MRLIPAKAGEFRQGQVYVRFGRVNRLDTHHLTENDHGRWLDEHDGVSMTEDALLDGWYLLDPSDDPEPVAQEPKRELQVGDRVRIVGLPEGEHGWIGEWRNEYVGQEFEIGGFESLYDCKCAHSRDSSSGDNPYVWPVQSLELVEQSNKTVTVALLMFQAGEHIITKI